MDQTEISLWRVACTLRRHKRKMMHCFGIVMAGTVLVIAFAPRVYQSEAKLLVRLGRENVGLDPTVTLGEARTINMSQSMTNEVNSVAAIIRSRTLLERVADEVGPTAILSGRPADRGEDQDRQIVHTAGPGSWGARLSPSSSLSARELAIRELEEALRVQPIEDSNLIQLIYESPDPALSQQVLANLIDSYLNEHTRLHRSPGAHEFITEQTAKLRDELAHAERKLRQLRNETGLVAPDEQRAALVKRIESVKAEVLEIEASVPTTEAELRQLRKSLPTISKTEIASDVAGIPNVAADQMRSQLYALQLKGEKLRATRTNEHPEVANLQDQITAAKAILAEEEESRTQKTLGPNRVRQEAELELIRKESLLQALTARGNVLRQQLDEGRQELLTLNENELRVAELQREVEICDAGYREYAAHMERARIERSLDVARMTNISVVQQATLDNYPVFPNVPLTLIAGFLLATLASGGVAFVAESVGNQLRTARQDENRCKVPRDADETPGGRSDNSHHCRAS